MKETYAKALHFVLQAEGSFSDDPSDSGGATLRGVTWADLASFRHKPVGDFPNDESQRHLVLSMTDAEMEAIYKGKYWDNNHCDLLPTPIDMIVFDTAVNCGNGQAAKQLSHSVGRGDVSSITLALVKVVCAEGTHLPAVITNFLNHRIAFYEAIAHGHNAKFLKGWLNRVTALKEAIK